MDIFLLRIAFRKKRDRPKSLQLTSSSPGARYARADTGATENGAMEGKARSGECMLRMELSSSYGTK